MSKVGARSRKAPPQVAVHDRLDHTTSSPPDAGPLSPQRHPPRQIDHIATEALCVVVVTAHKQTRLPPAGSARNPYSPGVEPQTRSTPAGARSEGRETAASTMAKRRFYPLEFREQLVELVRAGRTPEELGREFEPSAQAIRNWVRQEELDAGRRTNGGTATQVCSEPRSGTCGQPAYVNPAAWIVRAWPSWNTPASTTSPTKSVWSPASRWPVIRHST